MAFKLLMAVLFLTLAMPQARAHDVWANGGAGPVMG